MKAGRPSRFLAACIAATTLALGATACGDDEETQSLTFTITQQGKASELSGPSSAETGLAEITLENEGEKEGDVQLIRVEGDHSPEEVVAGFEQAGGGKAFPEWFFGGGGVGTTGAGESRTVTQVLEPGTYYALDTEGGRPDPKSIPAIEVTGEESGETVEGDATVSAFEYGFKAESLPSGETEIAFDNAGAQPHHLLAAPLIDDSTAEDVERYFKTEKGKAPVEEKETQATAVIEGGEGQLVTLDLEPGRYALFCFISDRQGGPPHALKGMVDEVEVE
ncbi:MAG TPA: hypothetical protein VF255_11090 [Solirubrobacterales bacterium]